MKKNTLAEAILSGEVKEQPIKRKVKAKRLSGKNTPSHERRKELGMVLIAGHYDPKVRSALFMIRAKKSHVGRTLQDMLGEAINDYCAKNGVPQPYKALVD